MNLTEISLTVTLNNQFIPWIEKLKRKQQKNLLGWGSNPQPRKWESYTLTTTPITQFKLGVRKAHFKSLNTSTGKMITFKFLSFTFVVQVFSTVTVLMLVTNIILNITSQENLIFAYIAYQLETYFIFKLFSKEVHVKKQPWMSLICFSWLHQMRIMLCQAMISHNSTRVMWVLWLSLEASVICDSQDRYLSKWYTCILESNAFDTCMWVDQIVLKLLTYLCEYTTELYQTYTEY